MIVVTTMHVEGFKIVDYCGIVRGIVVRSPTILQGFFGSLKNIIGGQIDSYSMMCEQTRQTAYEIMVEHAAQLGANAIIGMRYDASEVVSKYSASEVLCYGTAVVLSKL